MLGRRVAEREITSLLSHMGVYQKGTGRDPYQRPMETLIELMPQALADAREAGTQTLSLTGF